LDFNPEGKTVLVLGAGGTGRVITFSLLDMLAQKVFLWNRSPGPLEAVLKDQDEDVERIVPLQTPLDLIHAMKEAALVVNATSVGLNLKDGLPAEGLKFTPYHVVFDVIYHRETALLQQARMAGAKTSGGLGMLVYQGARSFEIWTGSPAPLEIMKTVLSQTVQGVN
jgi:shikimate dehydrogenase